MQEIINVYFLYAVIAWISWFAVDWAIVLISEDIKKTRNKRK